MYLVEQKTPVMYEFKAYDLWHKERLMAVRPGNTGLWHLEGRSRVKFDEMVSLDIRYARSWSLWLDIKIILQTPFTVISEERARVEGGGKMIRIRRDGLRLLEAARPAQLSCGGRL